MTRDGVPVNPIRLILTSLICACTFAVLWSIAPAFADESAPTLSGGPRLSLPTSDVGTSTPGPTDTPIPTGTPSPRPTVPTATPTSTGTATATPSPTSGGSISFRSQSGTDTRGTRL